MTSNGVARGRCDASSTAASIGRIWRASDFGEHARRNVLCLFLVRNPFNMQAITVAINQYAEKALGNRDYFLNKPYGAG
jgi:hypothetical protein